MLKHPTIDKLHALRLSGMASALTQQQNNPDIEALGFEERLGLLVEREASERESRQTSSRLRRAKLKFSDAVAEDIDYRTPRGLDRALMSRLLTGDWIREKHNTLIIGATGLGKTWLACALANQACRLGYTVAYLKMPRLAEELAIAHGSGRYARALAQWAKTDVLLMDDFAMAPMPDSARRDLLEILDDRHGRRSTIATSQILRSRTRKICNAVSNFMRSPSVRTPLPSTSSGFPSMHKRRSVQRRNELIRGFESPSTQPRRHDRFERF